MRAEKSARREKRPRRLKKRPLSRGDAAAGGRSAARRVVFAPLGNPTGSRRTPRSGARLQGRLLGRRQGKQTKAPAFGGLPCFVRLWARAALYAGSRVGKGEGNEEALWGSGRAFALRRACTSRREQPGTGTRTNSPTAYSKNYHFWQKKYVPRRATPTRIASRGAPQARKQAIWGDLGPYSTKAASKVASHEVVLRSVGLLLALHDARVGS